MSKSNIVMTVDDKGNIKIIKPMMVSDMFAISNQIKTMTLSVVVAPQPKEEKQSPGV